MGKRDSGSKQAQGRIGGGMTSGVQREDCGDWGCLAWFTGRLGEWGK